MKKVSLFTLALTTAAFAHHGVASLSIAGLEGPGAPLETTSTATLPEGKMLSYAKIEDASYTKYTSAVDDEIDRTTYLMYGFGYGFTPYLSAYAFIPYYTKKREDDIGSSGFHDIKLMMALGFKYDDGLMLNPKTESLDDMEDWHFTTYVNVSLPTGEGEVTFPNQNIDFDPFLQLTFGAPSFMLGFSATKWYGDAVTLSFDTSYNTFLEHTYSNNIRVKFADEMRASGAFTYKLYTNQKSKFRLDADLEANYLKIGRDAVNGVAQDATGGEILYTTIGMRLFYNTISIGAGVKIPTWTNLNEDSDQQGAEGKEKYRAIFTFSTLF